MEEYITRAKDTNTSFAILKLYVPENMRIKYIEAVEKHNLKMEKNIYPDAGFDLFITEDQIISKKKESVDFKVKCQMSTYNWLNDRYISTSIPTGFYLYPRSSISKKPLMLANSVGIIDSGYRGNIMCVFRYLDDENNDIENSNQSYRLEKYERIVQLVHPSFFRIFVHLVDNPSDLDKTERGDGGFGSTGKY